MKVQILVFLLVILLISCNANINFRPELQTKIDKLSQMKELNYNDSISISYLKDSCSKEELIKLIDYKVPIIRILAFRAIVKRDEKDVFEILKNHLSDTAMITWWYYDDAANDFTISDLMIRRVEYELSRQQKDTLIDLILKYHNYLGSADWMIKEIEPQEKYYSIIKSKASLNSDNCHDLGLSLAVSKFKKQSDIPFLKSKFSQLTDNPYCNDNIFKAIEIFPDTSFFIVLQHYFTNYIKKQKQASYDDLEIYCRAVAKYRNQNALNILKALTIKSTFPDDWHLPQNIEFVFKAIYKYNCSIYKDLYKQLIPHVDKDIFESIDVSFKDRPHTW